MLNVKNIPYRPSFTSLQGDTILAATFCVHNTINHQVLLDAKSCNLSRNGKAKFYKRELNKHTQHPLSFQMLNTGLVESFTRYNSGF